MKEKVAELCHEQWSNWMKYLFSKCIEDTGQFDKETGNLIIPKVAVDRWKRQLNTSYSDSELSEKEKDSDRIEADKFLRLFDENITYDLCTECKQYTLKDK